jgi:hypothetical protein
VNQAKNTAPRDALLCDRLRLFAGALRHAKANVVADTLEEAASRIHAQGVELEASKALKASSRERTQPGSYITICDPCSCIDCACRCHIDCVAVDDTGQEHTESECHCHACPCPCHGYD